MTRKQHTFAFDDAPFKKYEDKDALVVGVVTAGGSLLEGVLTTRVPMDGDDVAARLGPWIAGSRFYPSLRAIVCKGITIAGLSVIDLPRLHRETRLPVIAVDRKLPQAGRLEATLRRLGFDGRVASVTAAGPFHPFRGIYFACAGIAPAAASKILEQNHGRSHLPEGVRLAHLIAQGMLLGESKGGA